MYSMDLCVYNFFTDSGHSIKRYILFDAMTECAYLHEDYSLKGVPVDFMWVLYGWDIDFYEIPKLWDKLTIETIASGYEKYFGYRNFHIRREGKEIAGGRSLWLAVSKENRSLIKIPEDVYMSYGLEPSDDNFDRNIKPAKGDYKDLRHFEVLKRDIDMNDHLNNAKTISYVYECIDFKPKRFQIIYKKQLYLGEKFKITGFYDDEGLNYKVIGEDGTMKCYGKVFK